MSLICQEMNLQAWGNTFSYNSNGFTRRIALTQRQKATRKCSFHFISRRGNFQLSYLEQPTLLLRSPSPGPQSQLLVFLFYKPLLIRKLVHIMRLQLHIIKENAYNSKFHPTSTFSTTCFPNEQTLVEHVIVMFSFDSYLGCIKL